MEIKNRNWKQILFSLGMLLVVIILLCGLGYIVWLCISFFIDLLIKADEKISASIIGGMFTVFAGLAVVLITQHHIKRREIEEAHRSKKVEIYHEFLVTIEKVLQGENKKNNSKKMDNQTLIKYLVKFKTNIILWGSPKVLKAQSEYEKQARENGDLFLALDELYRAIREDIGLSNRGLSSLHLIKMYLSDPDELEDLVNSPIDQN